MPNRDETKAWVRAVLAHLELRPTELSRRIDRVPSTINRFLNDPDATHDLSRDTIERIAAEAKLRPYEMPRNGARPTPPGLSEPEAVPFDGEGADALLDRLVEHIRQTHNTVDPWLFRSPALIGAGYLPGDVLFVDLNERAKPRDVVCAQVYDWSRGRAQTVFRLYEPPYLLAASTDPALMRPFVVDDDAVIIKGVVIASLRPRRNLGLAA